MNFRESDSVCPLSIFRMILNGQIILLVVHVCVTGIVLGSGKTAVSNTSSVAKSGFLVSRGLCSGGSSMGPWGSQRWEAAEPAFQVRSAWLGSLFQAAAVCGLTSPGSQISTFPLIFTLSLMDTLLLPSAHPYQFVRWPTLSCHLEKKTLLSFPPLLHSCATLAFFLFQKQWTFPPYCATKHPSFRGTNCAFCQKKEASLTLCTIMHSKNAVNLWCSRCVENLFSRALAPHCPEYLFPFPET